MRAGATKRLTDSRRVQPAVLLLQRLLCLWHMLWLLELSRLLLLLQPNDLLQLLYLQLQLLYLLELLLLLLL